MTDLIYTFLSGFLVFALYKKFDPLAQGQFLDEGLKYCKSCRSKRAWVKQFIIYLFIYLLVCLFVYL